MVMWITVGSNEGFGMVGDYEPVY